MRINDIVTEEAYCPSCGFAVDMGNIPVTVVGWWEDGSAQVQCEHCPDKDQPDLEYAGPRGPLPKNLVVYFTKDKETTNCIRFTGSKSEEIFGSVYVQREYIPVGTTGIFVNLEFNNSRGES